MGKEPISNNPDEELFVAVDGASSSEPGDTGDADDAVIGQAFKRSLCVIGTLVGLAVVVVVYRAWTRPPEAVTEAAVPSLPPPIETPVEEIPPLPFADVTRQAGIDFVHHNGARGQKLLPETMGGGCAFLDYDNDGDQDILFVDSDLVPGSDWATPAGAGGGAAASREPGGSAGRRHASVRLYANDGAGRFRDVTVEAGFSDVFYGMGPACGDFDNDGWVDVFVTAVGANRLYRNEHGRFVDVTEQYGVAGPSTEWSTSAGWFDYDNDGDLDLFVCNYLQWTPENDLAQNFQLTGGGRAYGRPQDFGGTYSQLFRNDGDHFTDVSAEAGIRIDNPATGKPMGKSLGVTFFDVNGDGWLDIFVANDTVQNFLFLNNHDGTFREVGALAGIAFDSEGRARGAMGIDISHFRNDEHIGVAIGNFANEMTALYVSRDGDLFLDEAVTCGLGPATRLELTFAVLFIDCDLDGRDDLFAANGHLENDINRVQPSQHYKQPPQLFWNRGPDAPDEFAAVPRERVGPDFLRPMVGRGAAYADIDADGDLDLLVVENGGAARLLRNDRRNAHHWLRLKLVGRRSNRDAIGTRVVAHVGDRRLTRWVMPTRGYLSQVELPVTFGLGDADRVDRLEIRWPLGARTVLKDVSADRRIEVVEPDPEQPAE
ncbi:MAG: CRTAC1 family protein [Planctomycetota bacterium]|nr:MAG: CRTAC1 family protein [Planctomycetota bacterium]